MTTKQMNAHSHTNNRNRHWRTKILVNCLSFWCKSDKATHYAQTRWSSRWQRVSHSRNRTLAQGIDVRNIQAIRCTDHSRYHSDVSWLSSSGDDGGDIIIGGDNWRLGEKLQTKSRQLKKKWRDGAIQSRKTLLTIFWCGWMKTQFTNWFK